jgi:hypothetical protein
VEKQPAKLEDVPDFLTVGQAAVQVLAGLAPL